MFGSLKAFKSFVYVTIRTGYIFIHWNHKRWFFFFFFFFGKKGYASTHKVEILNFCNPELEYNDNKSVIGNKLKDILDESFVLEFTK